MAALFSVAVALNFPWEMAQAVLYQPMGSIADATRRCFVASVGDGLMILAVAMAGAVIHGDAWWFRRWSTAAAVLTVVAGTLIGVAVEWWGLSSGRWEYRDTMPRVPGLGFGVVPLLQIPLLGAVTLWTTGRWLSRRWPDA